MLKVTKSGNLVNEPDKTPKQKIVTMAQLGVPLEPPKQAEKKSKPAKPKAEKPPPPQRLPDVHIPSKMAKSPTVGQVASGAYQKKLKAHFAPVLIPGVLNLLNRKMEADDIGAAKILVGMYGMEPPKGPGVQVNLSQNNDNRSAVISTGSHKSSYGTADEMFRQLALDREKRALGPAPMEFTVIPDEEKAQAE